MATQILTKPRVAVLLAACLFTAPLWAAKVNQAPGKDDELKPGTYMYRFTNDQGVVQTSSAIPPQYAKNGYELVSLKGTVLRVVAPEPTEEERQALLAKAQDQLSEAEQRELDKQLLLRYSSEVDIQSEKKRKLAEIDAKIKMLEVNEQSTRQQIEHEQRKAAQAERNGQKVPESVVTALNNLQQEQRVLVNQREARLQEEKEEAARFDREIERFKQLEPYRR